MNRAVQCHERKSKLTIRFRKNLLKIRWAVAHFLLVNGMVFFFCKNFNPVTWRPQHFLKSIMSIWLCVPFFLFRIYLYDGTCIYFTTTDRAIQPTAAIKSHKISYEKAISISGWRCGWGYIICIFCDLFSLINIHFMRKYFKMKFHREIRVMLH